MDRDALLARSNTAALATWIGVILFGGSAAGIYIAYPHSPLAVAYVCLVLGFAMGAILTATVFHKFVVNAPD